MHSAAREGRPTGRERDGPVGQEVLLHAVEGILKLEDDIRCGHDPEPVDLATSQGRGPAKTIQQELNVGADRDEVEVEAVVDGGCSGARAAAGDDDGSSLSRRSTRSGRATITAAARGGDGRHRGRSRAAQLRVDGSSRGRGVERQGTACVAKGHRDEVIGIIDHERVLVVEDCLHPYVDTIRDVEESRGDGGADHVEVRRDDAIGAGRAVGVGAMRKNSMRSKRGRGSRRERRHRSKRRHACAPKLPIQVEDGPVHERGSDVRGEFHGDLDVRELLESSVVDDASTASCTSRLLKPVEV
mmetsp:Transcript_112223/g.317171  ORF Transcript_112223/g.317171 Transcript_112223/m.317171 type:complete len:300 (-) Transcript_112223:164-1063(-)